MELEKQVDSLLVMWNARMITGNELAERVWKLRGKSVKKRWQEWIKNSNSKEPLERLLV